MNKKDRTVELLEELVKWTRVTSIPHVKQLLSEILASPEEKIAYQSSNGKRTSRQVAKQANVSQKTVSLWWKKWIKAGIAEPVSARRGKRAKRLFSLSDFGIDYSVKGS
jgi:predicted HTH transcriptional regulator